MEENVNFNVENSHESETLKSNAKAAMVLPESLRLSQYALENLNEIRKWTRFFAVLGFIGASFMVLGGLLVVLGGSFSGLGISSLAGVLYIALAVLYFFPAYYLLNFSNKTKAALEETDEVLLEESMVELRKSTRFVGIMTIVILGLYVLMLVVLLFTFLAVGI